MPTKPTIGLIGLGLMGKPMAYNLLAAGFPLVVHNRSQGAVAELVAAGAADGGSPAGVAERAAVVITCLPDTATVQAIVAGERGVLEVAAPGSLIVDMSTIAPMAARELAAQAERRGIDFLDVPVSGGEVGARQATLSIMVGGRAAALDRARPVLEALGKTIVHVGGAGAGQIAKACNQIVVAVTIEAVSEALVLAAKAGVDPARVREALLGGFAQSRVLELHGRRMLDRDFRPGGKARHQYKDLQIILDAGRAYGAPLPITSLVHEFYGALLATGKGDLDHAALVLLIESLAGVEVRQPTGGDRAG
ncbi:MAG: 2-hydroxy-3-oxopropionate reductase [Roseiflexaceae bacterium]